MRETGERVGTGLVVLDSSANVRYVTHGSLVRAGYGDAGLEKSHYLEEGRRIAEYLRPDLQDGNVRIPATVFHETKRAVWKKAREWRRDGKLRPLQVDVVKKSIRHSISIERPLWCANNKSLLGRVRKMYHDIFNDPGCADLKKVWYDAREKMIRRNKKIKKDLPGNPDKVILSTAAGFALSFPVRFVVADIDFSSFAGEIRKRFRVEVIDLWRDVMRRGRRRRGRK